MKRLLLTAAAALFAVALPTAAQQQGVTTDTVTIGAHGPITGPAAYIGLAGRDGMLLAIKEINAAGGINGRRSSRCSRTTVTRLPARSPRSRRLSSRTRCLP